MSSYTKADFNIRGLICYKHPVFLFSVLNSIPLTNGQSVCERRSFPERMLCVFWLQQLTGNRLSWFLQLVSLQERAGCVSSPWLALEAVKVRLLLIQRRAADSSQALLPVAWLLLIPSRDALPSFCSSVSFTYTLPPSLFLSSYFFL